LMRDTTEPRPAGIEQNRPNAGMVCSPMPFARPGALMLLKSVPEELAFEIIAKR